MPIGIDMHRSMVLRSGKVALVIFGFLTLCLLSAACVSVSSLPQAASEIDFSDDFVGDSGWSSWRDGMTIPGVSEDQVYEAAKDALVRSGFLIKRASRSDASILGEHGMTLYDWNVVAGVYYKSISDGVEVRVWVEGSKDVGFAGDATGQPWPQLILASMRSSLAPRTAPSRPADREGATAPATSLGSGVVVTPSGHILTCYHVVESAQEFTIIDHKGIHHPAALVAARPDDDLALLKIDAQTQPCRIAVSTEGIKAAEICALGYPLPELQGHELKATFGRVNSLSGIGGDPRYFQLDAPIQPGSSGGPVIAADGTVLGLVSAKLSEIQVLLESGSMPQDVNYAVKIELAWPILEALPGVERAAPGGEGDFPAAVASMESQVVRVVASSP